MRGLSRRRDEDGAIAVMTVILSIVIFGVAAIAIDIGMLAMERQKLRDAVDSAAHAGAYAMPGDGATAINAARSIALANDSDLAWDFTQQNPKIRLWCVVASTGTTTSVRTDQIPSTCNPGTAPFTTAKYPDLRCNTKICKIPCAPSLSTSCNTVEVIAEKEVPFGFANVFGRSEGSTGAVASAACKGSCGEEAPNPLDVVFMADRTPSMSTADRESMQAAILDTLETMTPSLHYVAFGALHKSRTSDASCPSASTTAGSGATSGEWMTTSFSNNYLTRSVTPALNYSDPLVDAIDCLPAATGNYGTNLAAAMKGAGRYLTGKDGNNLSALPPRPGSARKVLIFETDGMPDETIPGTTYKGLGDRGDFSAGANGECPGNRYGTDGYCRRPYVNNGNGRRGCENFQKMAAELKAESVTVITIGFGEAATAGCDITNRSSRSDKPNQSSSAHPVSDYLAAAASANPMTGEASMAEGCNNATQIADENEDGDYFFCAASGSELADIFKTAVAQVSSGVRLVKLP